MIYIAQPYSHKDEAVMEDRFMKGAKYAGKLMLQGETVYAPIVHGHPIATLVDMPTSWEFWRNHCLRMLSKASCMHVLMLDGADESEGLKAEIEYCEENNIPIVYCVD